MHDFKHPSCIQTSFGSNYYIVKATANLDQNLQVHSVLTIEFNANSVNIKCTYNLRPFSTRYDAFEAQTYFCLEYYCTMDPPQLILRNVILALKWSDLKMDRFLHTLAMNPVMRRVQSCLPLFQSLCKEVKEKFAQGMKIEWIMHGKFRSVAQLRRVCSSCHTCMYISNIYIGRMHNSNELHCQN